MKHYLTILRHCGCLMLAIMVLASSAFAATPSVSNVSSSNQQDQLALTVEQEELAEINVDEDETDLGADDDESSSEEVEITPEVLDKVSRFCALYDIDMSEDSEFVSAILETIDENGWTDVPSELPGIASTLSSKSKKLRFIPSSKIADILWTNNPYQPFKHVAIYTSTTKIIEAMKGQQVAYRTVDQEVYEYPFKIYKVVQSDYKSRYSVDTRRSVASWAKAQKDKKYDKNFFNNKKNTEKNNAKMNCSELVWKAWKFKASVDLDSNGGPGVYPNNVRKSKRTVCIYKNNS